MIKWKQISSLILATGMVFSMTACGNSDSKQTGASTSPEASTEVSPEGSTEAPADTTGGSADLSTSFEKLNIGDNADLTANLKILTHRSDLVDTKFKEYITEFNKIYPNITIEYEAATDYADTITTRLTTSNWGQICMIPTSIDKDEFPNYFESFGKLSDLEGVYEFIDNREFGGDVYGIPSTGNAQGIVYNK